MKFGLPVFLSIILSGKPTSKKLEINSSTPDTTDSTHPFDTTFTFTSYTDVPAERVKDEYQYVFIGVYAVFVTIFAVTMILLCGKRIKKACCDRHPENDTTAPYEATGNIQDEALAQSPVSMDDDLLENTAAVIYDDDEYDYYSMDPDRMEETRTLLLDKPPPYDDPPPYSPA